MSRFSDGFVYGLGFWVSGILVSTITAVISILFLSGVVSLDMPMHRVTASVSSVVPRSSPAPRPVIAQIATAKPLTVAERQERDCNLALLQFSQTNSQDDKQRVYALCPDQ